jgi:serine/threonine-protein kinase
MSQQQISPKDTIIEFLRKRDYRLVRELGQGACGKTVLLHDDQIDENFVCKKYLPFSESNRQQLYSNFVREIKLLHQIQHPNVVRVFSYFLYPDNFTGYILMEFISGVDIEDHISKAPDTANDLFLQAISGFSYLEERGILHRDIRPCNLMVNSDNVLKIIDLGFGKQISSAVDFKKSISLNWWCEPPDEFAEGQYTFASEVYFVGKLFDKLVFDLNLAHFKYREILRRMCATNVLNRIGSFAAIAQAVRGDQFLEIAFSDQERDVYQRFSDALRFHITQIANGAKYVNDITRIRTQLSDAYKTFRLESEVPDAAKVLRCFVEGTYYYRKTGFPVELVSEFLRLIKLSDDEKARIILANLQNKLDTIKRYEPDAEITDDDIPF